jgi:hypothetical protein
VDTDYSTIFIKGCGNEDISCVGGGYQTFAPGLKTNPNNKINTVNIMHRI